MIHVHHAKNGGTIIGDCHLTIPVNHQLVKAWEEGIKGGPFYFCRKMGDATSMQDCICLDLPFGPIDVLSVEATAFAAIM